MSAYETLLTSLEAGVTRITLNRPEVRNALSRTMIAELERALAAAEADPRSSSRPRTRSFLSGEPVSAREAFDIEDMECLLRQARARVEGPVDVRGTRRVGSRRVSRDHV